MYLRPRNDWHFVRETERHGTSHGDCCFQLWGLLIQFLAVRKDVQCWFKTTSCRVGRLPQLLGRLAHVASLSWGDWKQRAVMSLTHFQRVVPFWWMLGVFFFFNFYFAVCSLLLYLDLEKMIISGWHAHVGSLIGSQSKSRGRHGPSELHGHIWVSEVLALNANLLLSFSQIIWRIQLRFNF